MQTDVVLAGDVMRTTLFVLLTLAAAGCGSTQAERPRDAAAQPDRTSAKPKPAPPELRDVTVGSFALKLAGCTLTYDGLGKQGSVTFEFPEPCQFSRDRNGAVRIVETGATKTLLVEASRPAGPGAGVTSRDCVTHIRGIVVSAKEIRLSAQTQKVAQCLPAVWDETMFHAFAARTEALPTKQ